MTSRTSALGTLLLAAILVMTSACGGTQDEDKEPSGPDRSHFVPITAKGVAAVVDRHLGDQVKRYSVLVDESKGKLAERTIEVTLRGGDRRDTFTVSVYPEDGSRGQVVEGSCDDAGTGDPQAKVTCTPVASGGNVTITHFAFGLSGGKKGTYLTASGTGPEEREATAAYDGFTRRVPVSDEDLKALMADPDLGWETDPATNKAGESLKVGRAD